MYQDERELPCNIPPCDCKPDEDYPKNPDWLWFFAEWKRIMGVVGDLPELREKVKENSTAIAQLLGKAKDYILKTAQEQKTADMTTPVGIDRDGKLWVNVGGKDAVLSVNGQTGEVILTAADVGALPADTPIPKPYILPVATDTRLGGVRPVSVSDNMTLDVGVDKEGRLYSSEEVEVGSMPPVSDTVELWVDLTEDPPALPPGNLAVNVIKTGLGTYLADYTSEEIRNHFNQGGTVELRYQTDTYRFDGMVADSYAQFSKVGVTEVDVSDLIILVDYQGNVTTETVSYAPEIPPAMIINPLPAVGDLVKVKSLNEDGTVKEWEPTKGGGGSTDISLGLTGVAPGDLIKVKSVDASDAPTAWEKTTLEELGAFGTTVIDYTIPPETEPVSALKIEIPPKYYKNLMTCSAILFKMDIKCASDTASNFAQAVLTNKSGSAYSIPIYYDRLPAVKPKATIAAASVSFLTHGVNTCLYTLIARGTPYKGLNSYGIADSMISSYNTLSIEPYIDIKTGGALAGPGTNIRLEVIR